MIRKIEKMMVTTDFSKCGNTALSHAFSLAAQLNAKLIVLYIVERETHDSGGYIDMKPLDSDEVSKKVKKQALEKLDELLTPDVTGDVEFEKVAMIDLKAEQGIEHAVEKYHPDLLVMASHGYTGFQKFMIGSSTDRVLRTVSCPVLMVKSENA